jgi:hypothetical protein
MQGLSIELITHTLAARGMVTTLVIGFSPLAAHTKFPYLVEKSGLRVARVFFPFTCHGVVAFSP